MRVNILLFACGVWLLQRQAELPAMAWTFLLCAPGAAAVWMRQRGLMPRVRRPVAAAVCFGLGFFWSAGFAHLRDSDSLSPAWEARDIRLAGVIASLPQVDARSVRFRFDVDEILTSGAHVPRRIALTWWKGRPHDERPGEGALLPHAGERWLLTVRLRRPRGMANPGGFDYEGWLFERGVRATGYVRARGDNRRVSAMSHVPAYWVEAAREALRGRIERALKEQPYAGVIIALAVGDQRAIPAEQWLTFTRTGVNHLMSISGLHVTMVSGLALGIAYALWRRSARLALRLPARKAAVLAALAAAFGYTLLAGFAVPAQRTLYMLAVAALALWMSATIPVSVVLAVALLAVLILDPWAVLAPGFWLSFGAVALIMYVTVGRIGRPHWLTNWSRVQWAVTLGLIPPLLVLFQQVSAVSPLANAIAIPVVSLVVVPLTLLGVGVPFDFLLHAAHWVMAGCMLVLEWMSASPASVWQQPIPSGWAAIAAVAGVAWLLLPRGFPARWLGAVAFMPMFFSAPAPLAEGEARITVLDVGHGLAVVARTRHHALLYDTGPAFSPGADSGLRVIIPYLRASGIRQLDAMVVSHDDIDHTGGASSVLGGLPVHAVLTSLPDMDPLLLESERPLRCQAGQGWQWDGVAFEMLGPQAESYEDLTMKDNDRSCVLRISTAAGRILLPADVERRAERGLLVERGEQLAADVLLAPHQGSKSSSSAEFLARVNPRVVIFPVGYRNRFGHPHAAVLERYRARGSAVYRTDRDGAITLRFTRREGLYIEPHRAVYRRYWHTRFVDDPVPPPAVFPGAQYPEISDAPRLRVAGSSRPDGRSPAR